ncbi:MAG TPA: helix-turn-helix transcriptional regulator [Alphaproteobacteria bacterium]|nr:helix-turn-helix transcriptional regulator [Alphaproteobacteria bacterium]
MMQATPNITRSDYSTQLLRQVRRSIGANIWRARQRRRMTIKKLSQLSGVPEWRIDQYELGKNEIKLDDLLRLSCALGVGMEKIIAFDRPHRIKYGHGQFCQYSYP